VVAPVVEGGVLGEGLELLDGDVRRLAIAPSDERRRVDLHEAPREPGALRDPEGARREIGHDPVGRDERVDGTAIAERARLARAAVVAEDLERASYGRALRGDGAEQLVDARAPCERRRRP